MVKRILIRSAIAVVCVLVLIAGIVTLTRGWSGSRLEKLKRELRGRVVRPDVAQAAWKQTNAWAEMHALLDEGAVPLAAMREALKSRPRDVGWDYTNWNTYRSGLIEIRQCAHWLASAVAIELNRGRRVDALTNLLSLLDLAHCHEGEGTFVNQMVRIAVMGMAFGATWEALQATGWKDKELAALQHSWQQFTMAKPLEFSLLMTLPGKPEPACSGNLAEHSGGFWRREAAAA